MDEKKDGAMRVAHRTPVKDTGWMPRTHAQFSAVVQKNRPSQDG